MCRPGGGLRWTEVRGAGAARLDAMGKESVKQAPPSGRFSAEMSPPSRASTPHAIDRPSPVPRLPLVVKNGSKIFAKSSPGNAATFVEHLEDHALALLLGDHADRAAPRHGVARVEEQIDDDVTEVGREPGDRRQNRQCRLWMRIGRPSERALPFDPRAHDVDGFADDGRRRRPIRAADRAFDARNPAAFRRPSAASVMIRDSARMLSPLLGLASRLCSTERKAKAHGVERVVEVVGDARCELADGAHPLLLYERFAQVVELELGALALLRARRWSIVGH